MKRLIWIALGYMVLIVPVQAASFDCAKASTPQEKLICFDYRLSDLDSQLAWSYSEALKQAKDISALKQSQKDWVATRGKCLNVDCILHAYVGRIEALAPDTKLEEVYFPKGKIPWDFSPKHGYDVSSLPKLKENKLTYPTYLKGPIGTLTHGEDLVIPEDKYSLSVPSSGVETTKRLQRLQHVINSELELAPNSETIELGDIRLAFTSLSYGECEGGLGMSGIFVGRNVPWSTNNVLVPLRPHGWTVWKRSHDACYEAQLKIDPTLIEADVFDGSLYLSEDRGESDFVIRLDRNLQTASPVLGKKIYLVWGS